MPLTSFLIANKFGVIVIFLTKRGSLTIFPLWKGPGEFMYHQMITLSLVYNNHYVMVQLERDFSMSTISVYWRRHKDPCTARWKTVYKLGLELYQQLKPRDPEPNKVKVKVKISNRKHGEKKSMTILPLMLSCASVCAAVTVCLFRFCGLRTDLLGTASALSCRCCCCCRCFSDLFAPVWGPGLAVALLACVAAVLEIFWTFLPLLGSRLVNLMVGLDANVAWMWLFCFSLQPNQPQDTEKRQNPCKKNTY
ncbi:hypothetical protein LXL04_020123 [Taraxacum kok-saghyz]